MVVKLEIQGKFFCILSFDSLTSYHKDDLQVTIKTNLLAELSFEL